MERGFVIRLRWVLVFMGVLLLTLCGETFAAETGSEGRVTIYHTNDMHGNLATTANAAGSDYLAVLKGANGEALLLDGGDATQGVALASLSQGADVITLMNAAGYDAMALGNHEFDYGQAILLRNAQAANFPMLGANVLKEGRPFLEGTSYADGTKTNNGAWVMLEVQGTKVGVFGITTPETAYKTNPLKLSGITFADPAATAQVMIETLKTEGAEVIICLAHMGVDPSTEYPNSSVGLAEALGENSGLDVIIDGHSHTQYPAQKTAGILIQQAYYASSFVGKITIAREAGVNTAEGELLGVAAIKSENTPQEAVTVLIDSILEKIAEQTQPVIGKAATTLWGGVVGNANESRLGETNLGDFITDVMVQEARAHLEAMGSPYVGTPIVALENGGGIRASLLRGDITMGNSLEVLPFGNTVAFKRVTPAILYEALENGVSGVREQNPETGQITGAAGRFPQISGMSVIYNPEKMAGSRVVSIILEGESAPLDPQDTTRELVLASNDFEIAGGDGYTMLAGLPSLGESDDLETLVRKRITTLTETQGGVEMKAWQGRIKTQGTYVPKAYVGTVTVNLAEEAGQGVEYILDNGAVESGALNENRQLLLTLEDGPHTLRIGDGKDVLINNYSGAGTTAENPVEVAVTNPLINPVQPTPEVTVEVTPTPEPEVVKTLAANVATGQAASKDRIDGALLLLGVALALGGGGYVARR